jgi:hypothetical protein
MSKITTLYDTFIGRVEAVLPNHLRLSDPYLFEKNTDSEKRQGYGVRISSGEHTGNNVSCDIILRQEFTLVLTRISQGRELAAAKKVEAEKQLLEDLFLVIKDIEGDSDMSMPTVVVSGAYVSHNGIEFITGQRDDLLKIEASFSFRYREDFN